VVIFGSDTAGKQLVYVGIITDAGANKKILLYVVERMCNSDYAVVLVFCIFLLYSLLRRLFDVVLVVVGDIGRRLRAVLILVTTLISLTRCLRLC